MSVVIVWDLDDTLIETGYKYQEFINQFVSQYFKGDAFKFDEHINAIKKLDGQRVLEFGFKPNRLIESMLMYAYKHDLYTIDMENWLRTYYNIFIKYGSYNLILNVYDVLVAANKWDYTYNYILTSGVKEMQTKKINYAQLNDYIDGVEIIEHFKTKKDFKDIKKKIIKEECLDDSTLFISVGNSLKSDIYPAIEAGFYGIFLETDNNATFYDVEKKIDYSYFYTSTNREDFKLDDLQDVIEFWQK